MSFAQLIRDMAAAGAPPEAIALAVDAIESVQSKLEEKRAIERDRKRRQRERDKDGTVTGLSRDKDGTVTGLSRDKDGTVTDSPPLSRPPNENISNPPTHTPPDIYPARVKADDFPRLDCAKPEVWRDFLKNRKAKRLPCTATAHKRLERDLEAMAARTGWPPGEVFEACVGKGWGAIYDPRESDNGRSNQTVRAIGSSNRSSLARAIDEGLEFLGGSP